MLGASANQHLCTNAVLLCELNRTLVKNSPSKRLKKSTTRVAAPALHRGCLREMERELKLEIDTLERLKGEANPIFCLCLAGLSSEGIDRVGIEGTQT